VDHSTCGALLIAAAQAFAERGSFQYKNQNVLIRLLQFHLPEEACDGSRRKEQHGKKERATERSSEFRCVIVRGFPQPLSADDVEQFELVFESESRSGGGPLECPIEVNDDHLQLAITYQSADGELWRCWCKLSFIYSKNCSCKSIEYVLNVSTL
jgi:hypothetical protein